jgi:hypothetical protein
MSSLASFVPSSASTVRVTGVASASISSGVSHRVLRASSRVNSSCTSRAFAAFCGRHQERLRSRALGSVASFSPRCAKRGRRRSCESVPAVSARESNPAWFVGQYSSPCHSLPHSAHSARSACSFVLACALSGAVSYSRSNSAVERDASQARFARLLAPLTFIRWAS